ncbi:hypothetical protein BDZ94DRAFT_1325900 [Collybia nuda]|uniref:Uncharacterized protein n=1 Tax=Collybia nuda TaxID=64659 RepID=A0A9P5XW72_9AGAR|nr:hypothetical protein BDZ94DRAFT_1325900 [Collybia nuda]
MKLSMSFSPELIDLIINHLHDHSESLLHCALVGRNWTFAARYHLFSAVTLHKSLSSYNPNKNVPRLELFLRLLNSPHSTIRPQDVHEITLIFSSRNFEYFSYLVTRTTACLPALKSLNILIDPTDSIVTRGWHDVRPCEVRPDDVVRNSFYKGFSESPLNWSNSTENFIRIVSSIPRLQRLKNTWSPPTEVSNLSLWKFPSHLRHLTVQTMKTAMMRWWLADERRLPIHSVELYSVYPTETPSIGAFLKTLGSSLMDLRVSFKGPRIVTEEAFRNHVNLAYNTSLRSLEIGDVSLEPRGGPVYFAWLFAILSQITSKAMKHLKIWLCVGQATFELFDWGKLDGILATSPFDCLETLTFSTYVFNRRHNFSDAVTTFLPSCQGRIQVEHYEAHDYEALQV